MDREPVSDWSLLPAGLQDLLPPAAAFEAASVARLLASFEAQGYQQVKPPLIEFEEALLSGTGAALTAQTFRLMDPVSQRMMGLRADITPQVVRLAASRLGRMRRGPLRLCYAGQVLRVRGSQLRPERQFTQVGLELIECCRRPAADAEADRAWGPRRLSPGRHPRSVGGPEPAAFGRRSRWSRSWVLTDERETAALRAGA